MKNLKRFLRFILRFKSYIIFAFIFMSLSVLLSLPMPLLTKYLIDNVIETKKKAISPTPFILLMDEPTSQLDSITERAILEFLKEYKNKKTIIIVAHKEGILEIADKVVEIDFKKF